MQKKTIIVTAMSAALVAVAVFFLLFWTPYSVSVRMVSASHIGPLSIPGITIPVLKVTVKNHGTGDLHGVCTKASFYSAKTRSLIASEQQCAGGPVLSGSRITLDYGLLSLVVHMGLHGASTEKFLVDIEVKTRSQPSWKTAYHGTFRLGHRRSRGNARQDG